jgi:hypothetical protein
MRQPKNIEQTNKMTKDSQRFAKLKEVQANTKSQRFCTTFNFAPTHPNPPATPKDNLWTVKSRN